MKFDEVNNQLNAVIARSIKAGISVQQNTPAVFKSGNILRIGDLRNASVSMKDIPYKDIYKELENNNQFHIKLPDGGLLIFQYTFLPSNQLLKHRLSFFPNPNLPTVEEAPELYDNDILYSDIIKERIVRFPIRVDYDPDNYQPKLHPHAHITLGQFENCRIPLNQPVSPNRFLHFILRNFYHKIFQRNLNIFEKKIVRCTAVNCITDRETSMPHFVF